MKKTNEEIIEKDIVAEFYCGTKSFSNEANKYGLETWTTDIDKTCKADLTKDILELKKEDINFIPTILWFSTPCEQYSHAKRRGIRNLEYADKCAKKCFEIISWFPQSIWFIENPQTGLLKNRDFMKDIYYQDVSYCKYGLPYRKQTRIWTNFRFWKPKNICKKDCEFMENGKHICSVGNGRKKYTKETFTIKEKYKIPRELCSEILQSILSSRKAIQEAQKESEEEIENWRDACNGFECISEDLKQQLEEKDRDKLFDFIINKYFAILDGQDKEWIIQIMRETYFAGQEATKEKDKEFLEFLKGLLFYRVEEGNLILMEIKEKIKELKNSIQKGEGKK